MVEVYLSLPRWVRVKEREPVLVQMDRKEKYGGTDFIVPTMEQ